MTTNKDIYAGVEFSNWASRSSSVGVETYLFKKYFKKNKATLDAGTGNGRIAYYLEEHGFKNLYACDYIEGLISLAKKKKATSIVFEVNDICQTNYKSGQFAQMVYLTQVLSFVDAANQKKASVEAYRILDKQGIAIFSFNCIESRNDLLFKLFHLMIKLIRDLKQRAKPLNSLPWIRLGGRFNWSALFDKPPYVCWFSAKDAQNLLEDAGFVVVEIGTDGHYHQNCSAKSGPELDSQYFSGPLYVVCKK